MRKHSLYLPITFLACSLFYIWFAYTYKIDLAFTDDAGDYSALAQNMLNSWHYSVDGVTSFYAREPGYSVFLLAVYALFGTENWFAVVITQIILFALGVRFFTRSLEGYVSKRVQTLFSWLIILHPAIWVAHVSILRESLTITLLLFIAGLCLRSMRNSKAIEMSIAGMLMGFAILTTAPLFLMPVGLIPIIVWQQVKLKHGILCALFCALTIMPWAVRNIQQTGDPCLAGCNRSGLLLALRGEQAETLRGLEPLWCMGAEYITRDWSNRSKNCHINAVKNRLFPNGFVGNAADAALGEIGKQKVKDNFAWYLWHSAFEVLELHLPYANSWGLRYNLAVSAYSLIVTLLAIVGLFMWQRWYWFILAPVAYVIGIYIVSDAIPRYLIPVLFVYCLLAAVGLVHILQLYERKHNNTSL